MQQYKGQFEDELKKKTTKELIVAVDERDLHAFDELKEMKKMAQEANIKGLSQNFIEEMVLLKTELRLAIEAEEISKKAMDDLVLALTEVTKESIQIKEKLVSTQIALEYTKEEAEHLKTLLSEAKKEADRLKNTVERLRLEAEDSLLAWNGKEMGFVDCMKRFEEDRTATQQENKRLLSSLLMAEKMTTKAKEENHKLRDILKQALNEANAAKEAASMARTENSQLKDQIKEKENSLELFTVENEDLKIKKEHANENIKELNRKLSFASVNDLNSMDKEQEMKLKNHNSLIRDHHDGKKISKAFSFDLNELRIPINKDKDVLIEEVDLIKDEALKGSIFDTETPKSAPFHRRRASTSFNGNKEKIKSMDFDHLDESHVDDTDHGSKKKKALLRKFSNLIRGRSFQKRDEVV